VNKAKRFDNRMSELASKSDAKIKCFLLKTHIPELNEIMMLIHQLKNSNESNLNESQLQKLKLQLKLLPGPYELCYESLLREHRIHRSTAHGGGFNGNNAWLLFQTPQILQFLAPRTWERIDG
jgi:hypothetical protein